MPKIELTCMSCGASFFKQSSALRPNQRTFCSKQCHVRGQFVHGRNVAGYRVVRVGGKQVYEHRLLMERHIGRVLLATEHVHHINGDKTDNRIENLMVIEKSAHHSQHVAPSFDVDAAATLYKQGIGYRKLAALFGVARQNIRACFVRRGIHIEGRKRTPASD